MDDSWSILWIFLFLAYWIIPAKVYGKLSEDMNRGKKWWGWVPLPFFRFCLLLEIAGMSGWWILLWLIPIGSNLASAKIWYKISKIYTKSTSESIMVSILGFFILGIIPGIYYAYFCNSQNKDFEKYDFSTQQSKSNKIKEDASTSNWMTETQKKEFEALCRSAKK